jgi:hypothetical protein
VLHAANVAVSGPSGDAAHSTFLVSDTSFFIESLASPNSIRVRGS